MLDMCMPGDKTSENEMLTLESNRGGNSMASVKDPVCGMEVDSNNAVAQSDYNGQTYYFCATECKEKFDANPQQFATERGESARP